MREENDPVQQDQVNQIFQRNQNNNYQRLFGRNLNFQQMGSDEIEQVNDDQYIEDFTDREQVNDYDENQQYI